MVQISKKIKSKTKSNSKSKSKLQTKRKFTSSRKSTFKLFQSKSSSKSKLQSKSKSKSHKENIFKTKTKPSTTQKKTTTVEAACNMYKKDLSGKETKVLYNSCKINKYCRKYKCNDIDEKIKKHLHLNLVKLIPK